MTGFRKWNGGCKRQAMRRIGVTLLVWLSAQTAFAQSASEQSELVEKARQVAAEEFQSLPDFIALETIRREALGKGSSSWKPQDTVTLEVTLVEGQEQYKLLTLNGKPTRKTKADLNGMKISGEFGPSLWRIFDPGSKTQFKCEGTAQLQNRTVDVCSYRVEKDHSQYGYDFHDGHKGSLAYGGSVYIDRDSHQVLKMTYSAAGMPNDWPIAADSGGIDYTQVDIGGKPFLMPQRAEWNGAFRNGSQIRSVTEFSNYHKFVTDTKLGFETQ